MSFHKIVLKKNTVTIKIVKIEPTDLTEILELFCIVHQWKVCCRYDDGCVVNVPLSSQVGLFNVHFCIHRRVAHLKAAIQKRALKNGNKTTQSITQHKISSSVRSELYLVYFNVIFVVLFCHCCDILRTVESLFSASSHILCFYFSSVSLNAFFVPVFLHIPVYSQHSFCLRQTVPIVSFQHCD